MMGLLILNLGVVITHFTLTSDSTERQQQILAEVASIAVMTLWLYSLYWLRIFANTAFFI
jgi:hypothetical protein